MEGVIGELWVSQGTNKIAMKSYIVFHLHIINVIFDKMLNSGSF